MTKIQTLIGLPLVIGSLFVGIIGTAWNVFAGYSTIQHVEATGISSTGNYLEMAMAFSAGGIIGAVAGILILIFGRQRRVK